VASPGVGTQAVDPFLVSKFWVEVDGLAEAVFRECSGLVVETEVLEYAEGGVNDYVHRLPGRTKHTNITLKRGWTQSDELWSWYEQIIAGKIERKAVSIVMYENKGRNPGRQVARWNLQGAYPVKWQGPELRSDGSAVAVETLVLAHAGWKVAHG